VHTRLEVPVLPVLWYSLAKSHVVSAVHTRLPVAVGAVDWNWLS
jgi:hypothetical protein